MNTPITVAMTVQGDAAASTPGGLWRMNFEEGITHFLEKRVKLTDVSVIGVFIYFYPSYYYYK
jgi:hypothetical protein